MPAPVHNRENRDGVRLDTEEHREGEATNLRPANVACPQRVESGVSPNAGPAGFDLAEKLQPESAPLEFVPKELGLQLELSAFTDA
jgi:hypothetical protein